MRQLNRIWIFVAFVVPACGVIGSQKPETAPTLVAALKEDALNSDPVIQDFKQRLDRYIMLQKKVANDSLPLKETTDPAKITAAQDVLAEKLRAIRKNAMPGDIFTPPVRAKFRQVMSLEAKGTTGTRTREVISGGGEADEIPRNTVIKVNATYSSKDPLPTVPPNLLTNLPALPMDVEYRIVGKTLILRDVDANIIVDFIPNAIR